MDSLQQQIHFNGNIFRNKLCRSNESFHSSHLNIADLGGAVGCASTGDQGVAGSIPAGDLIMKYVLWPFYPFR